MERYKCFCLTFLTVRLSCNATTFLVFFLTNCQYFPFLLALKFRGCRSKRSLHRSVYLTERLSGRAGVKPRSCQSCSLQIYSFFFCWSESKQWCLKCNLQMLFFPPQHYNTSLLAAAAAAVSASDDQELLHSRFFPYTSSQMFLDQLNAGGSSSLPATNGSNSGSNSSLVSSNSLRENHGHPVASRSGADTASIFGIISDIISLD